MEYYHTKVNDKMYYGKHAIIDCKSCNTNISNIDMVSEFIKSLVQKIDMVAHGDLVIDRFGEGDDVGISACQLIITSSITIHTNDKHKDLYLDVFSCKWFDEKIIINMINTYFWPETLNTNILLRG
jgi:S-adenosylmethionine/arginine decarboxylase-like enzyme